MRELSWILAGKWNFRAVLLALVIGIICLPAHARAGSKLKVEKIVFTGNHSIPEKTLKSILKSREKKEFNPRFFKLDRILLSNYYTLRGFRDVYVSGKVTKTGNKVVLEYIIREGISFKFNQLKFVGNEQFSSAQLREYFRIRPGQPYERPAIEQGLNAVENLYLDNGKPYVLVNDREEVVDDSLVNVIVYIQEGETVRIVDMKYEGKKLAKSFLIRRELEIHKNDVYSRKKIETSQRNIYSTGLFKFVHYRLAPVNDDPTRVLLVWEVVERKPVWLALRFGIGRQGGETANNATTFDITAEAGHRNLFGTARQISFKVVPSFFYGSPGSDAPNSFTLSRNYYSFTYVEPWVMNTRTPGVFNVSYSDEKPPVSPQELNILSASFNISHIFENYWSYKAGVSLQRVRAQARSILEEVSQGRDLIYALSINPVRDKRDNLLNPHRGHLTEFSNKFVYSTSPRTISGRETTVRNTFYKLVMQWSRYQPFRFKRRWTLATRVRTSGILEAGGRKLIDDIPITERFYLGGGSSIRGYKEQFIGRRDTLYTDTGEIKDIIPKGGKFVLLANVELRIPLFWLFYGEVFVDAGNLWEELEQIRPADIKASTGLGLAIVTPFGPIRFDYGFKLFPEKEESASNFHIGISFAF